MAKHKAKLRGEQLRRNYKKPPTGCDNAGNPVAQPLHGEALDLPEYVVRGMSQIVDEFEKKKAGKG